MAFDYSIKINALDRITSKIKKINTRVERMQKKAEEKVNVNLNPSRALRGISRINNKIKELSKEPVDIGLSFASLASSAALLGMPIKKSIELESAFASVKKVVDGTDSEIAKLKTDLVAMTNILPKTAVELTQIAEAGAKMGIPINQLTEYTEVVAKASTAFDMSADEAGAAFGKIASQLGYNIPQLRKYGDIVNSLADSMATDARNIIDITKRTAGATSTLGFDTGTIAGLAAFTDQMSVSSEVGATALNQILNSVRSTQEGMQILQEKGGYGLIEIAKRFKQLKGVARTQAIERLFGTGEGSRMFEKLINQTDVLKKSLDTALDPSTLGSMQREFENVSNTTANKIRLLRNGIDRLSIGLGDIFIPKVNELIEILAPMIDRILEWSKNNRELIMTIGKIVAISGLLTAGFLLIKAVLVPVTLAMKLYTSTLVAMGVVMKAAKIGMLLFNAVFLANPIGLAVLAVTALVTGIGYLIGGIDGAKDAFLTLASPITIVLKLIDNLLSKFELYNKAKEKIKNIAGGIGDTVSGAWEGAKNFFDFNNDNAEKQAIDNTNNINNKVEVFVKGEGVKVENVKANNNASVKLNNERNFN